MKKVIFIVIVLIAFILRFYLLDTLPALNADEAALGYNAYSLLETGKDEHGNSWPIHFQSFNDFKPGFYVYLLIPFIAVFGLTELAVRIPGALAGVGTVIILYFFIKQLFPKYKYLTEVGSLMLAVSPWHLHFSRGGWEVNVATFFILLGVFLSHKALQNIRVKLLLFASLAFIASLYTYHSARIIVPLLGLVMLIIYKKHIFKFGKKLIWPGLVVCILIIPLVADLLKPSSFSRAAGVGIFTDDGPYWRVNEQRGEHISLGSPLALFLHNKPINYTLAFFQNYMEHFSGEFLFISGDEIQRNKVPDVGQMLLIDIIFLIFGFTYIFKNFSANWAFVLSWLFIAPIAASLTFQTPHALRAQNMVIPLIIISAYGAISITELINRNAKPKALFPILYFLLSILYFWDASRYLHQYYFHLNKSYDYASQWEVKELVEYIKTEEKNYEKIIVTTAYDQPYILFFVLP